MRTRVAGGTLVTPYGSFAADVLCEDGLIAAIELPGSRSAVDEEVDASGSLVFPGIIDPHIHSRDPGLTAKEDFAHATRAAAAGGVTTVFEMPNVVPPCSDAQVLEARALGHAEHASVDFCLWGMSFGLENIDDIAGMLGAGAIGIKLFWSYGLRRDTRELVYDLGGDEEAVILPPNAGDVHDVCSEVARLGGLFAAHCEDRALLEAAQRSLGRDLESYDDLLLSRPDVTEAASVATAAELSRATGCRFHVLHMSSARGAAIVARAQADGIAITAETCPQYLFLTRDDHPRLGARMKVYPPVRETSDRDALWAALAADTIGSLSSDHAPHTIEEKQRSLHEQPAGAIGVETLLPLMLDAMAAGRISAERLAWLLSEGTARLYGLYPRKGSLRPGSDADLTIVDPNAEWTIDDELLHSKNRLSMWHGRTCKGRPSAAVLRGAVVMRDQQPVGPPRGEFVRKTTAADDGASPELVPAGR